MQANDIYITEEEVLASICRESFHEFVLEFWDTVENETPIWNWHIPYICNELQTMAERVFKGEKREYDLILNVPPGSTKSLICSVLFPAWVWTRMPTARFITGSYAAGLSTELSRKSRKCIESEKYQACFGIKLTDDQNKKEHYENSAGGWRFACGVGGVVTGYHAHFILVDDPLNPKEAATKVGIKNANEWMSKTLPSRKVNKEVTVTLLIMQRLAVDDPTAEMEKRNPSKVRKICLPGRLSDKVYPLKLRRYYKNGLFDPNRLNEDVLLDMEKDLGTLGFSAQVMQDPKPAGSAMINANKMQVRVMDDKLVKVVRSWDKAASPDDGDYTVGVKMGIDRRGHFWILDVVRGQWDTAERQRMIKKTAESDGQEVIISVPQDPGSAGKDSVHSDVIMLAGYSVKAIRPTTNKVARADTFSVQVNHGNVSMIPAPWNEEYKNELLFFPNWKNDDQADASSDAFSLLSKPKKKIGGW